jgi:SpoVK/Ycf46/Vps4 family AAA+-type ATPase
MVRELFVMARYHTRHTSLVVRLSGNRASFREHAPSIIFMDEVDSIGSTRIESSGGDSEVQRTVQSRCFARVHICACLETDCLDADARAIEPTRRLRVHAEHQGIDGYE